MCSEILTFWGIAAASRQIFGIACICFVGFISFPSLFRSCLSVPTAKYSHSKAVGILSVVRLLHILFLLSEHIFRWRCYYYCFVLFLNVFLRSDHGLDLWDRLTWEFNNNNLGLCRLTLWCLHNRIWFGGLLKMAIVDLVTISEGFSRIQCSAVDTIHAHDNNEGIWRSMSFGRVIRKIVI